MATLNRCAARVPRCALSAAAAAAAATAAECGVPGVTRDNGLSQRVHDHLT